METFSGLLAICAGNSPVTGEFPAQRPMTWSFDVFFDLRLNTRLSKQSWGWWFEMPSRPLWHYCNVFLEKVFTKLHQCEIQLLLGNSEKLLTSKTTLSIIQMDIFISVCYVYTDFVSEGGNRVIAAITFNDHIWKVLIVIHYQIKRAT